jgi:hypothetical protein
MKKWLKPVLQRNSTGKGKLVPPGRERGAGAERSDYRGKRKQFGEVIGVNGDRIR